MVVCCHLQSFQDLRVLTASCSSISGKHSVACFIGVISRFKRFPFWFPRTKLTNTLLLYERGKGLKEECWVTDPWERFRAERLRCIYVSLTARAWNWITKRSVSDARLLVYRTSQKTHCSSITKTNQLMLFREVTVFFFLEPYWIHNFGQSSEFLNV